MMGTPALSDRYRIVTDPQTHRDSNTVLLLSKGVNECPRDENRDENRDTERPSEIPRSETSFTGAGESKGQKTSDPSSLENFLGSSSFEID